jgi:hypothetical protein
LHEYCELELFHNSIFGLGTFNKIAHFGVCEWPYLVMNTDMATLCLILVQIWKCICFFGFVVLCLPFSCVSRDSESPDCCLSPHRRLMSPEARCFSPRQRSLSPDPGRSGSGEQPRSPSPAP